MSRHHRALSRGKWAAVRVAVFERDGWRCIKCGKVGRLEADHINSLEREPGQNPYDPNGLQTLCRTCHVAKNRRDRPGFNAALQAARDEWRAMVADLADG